MRAMWNSRFVIPIEIGLITLLFSVLIIGGMQKSIQGGLFSAEDICLKRPWDVNFAARVLSAEFFDPLCAHRGFYANTEEMQPLPGLQVGNGASAVEEHRDIVLVQIAAQPQRIPSSGRSSIYWVAESVVSCEVRGPGVQEIGLRGFSETPILRTSATYIIVCRTEDGRQVREETTVHVQ